jgi:phage shock protein PspC (stress-responsive transcriptional regulator)
VLAGRFAHDEDMTSTPAPVPTPALDRFFAMLRRSPLRRSSDRVIAGVSAGVADRLGVSRAIVRVGMVALALLGPGVLLYLLAWLLLPDAQGQLRIERAVRGGDGGSIVLLVLSVLSLFSTFSTWGGHGAGHLHTGPWPLLVLAGIALVGHKKGWWQGHSSRPTNPAPTTTRPTAPPSAEGPQDAPPA